MSDKRFTGAICEGCGHRFRRDEQYIVDREGVAACKPSFADQDERLTDAPCYANAMRKERER